MRKSLLFVVCCLSLVAGSAQAIEKKKIYVADRTIVYEGKDCLQFKEKKKDKWRTYCGSIDGLKYTEGYEYKLSVAYEGNKEKFSLTKILSNKKTGFNPASKLENKKWILYSFYDGEHPFSWEDTSMFVQFNLKESKVTGKIVCNTFTGKMVADTGKIKITDVATTKIFCKGLPFENAILALFQEMTAYKIEVYTLTLSSTDGTKTMRLKTL